MGCINYLDYFYFSLDKTMFKKNHAKKSLGQNFLTNKSKLRKIADALDLKKGDTIIEIGPGHGELTEELRIKNKELRIITIEKDRELAGALKKKFFQDKNIEVIEGDALKILPALNTKYKIQDTGYKLAGNIPYYITGYLLRVISELQFKPELTILTLQKEVAQRICALRQAQGKPNMNLLAASVQFWAEPKIIGYISKKDFRPAPKVDSAIIKLQTISDPPTPRLRRASKLQAENYYKFIKILFKQPRKTILNNLISSIKNQDSKNKKERILEILKNARINPLDRPQNLNIEQITNCEKPFFKL